MRGLYQKIGDVLWLHLDGRTYTVSLQGSSPNKARSRSHAFNDGLLKSPMPGKIVKVSGQPGEKVSSGKTVCVIEAMKMEYALKAPFSGKIKAVFKKAGDQVLLDEPILKIEGSS